MVVPASASITAPAAAAAQQKKDDNDPPQAGTTVVSRIETHNLSPHFKSMLFYAGE